MTNAKLSHLSKCDFTGLPLLKTAFKCQFVVLVNCWTYLTCNSAANFAPARTDAGAVPNHPILWSLICFTNLVCPQIVLIITGFLHCKQKQWKVWILFGFFTVLRMFLHPCRFQTWKERRHGSFLNCLTLTFGLSFTFDAPCAIAGAQQRAATVGFLPLLVWSVGASVFLAAD